MDVPIAHKKCATCRWWSGSRNIRFVGANPEFVTIKAVLPGANCRAWPDKRPFSGTATCFRWSRWEKL